MYTDKTVSKLQVMLDDKNYKKLDIDRLCEDIQDLE
jgi:hypothetical protein